jgi:hypothetical protein
MTTKRYLDVRYDVTDLTPDEIGNLCLEAVVQGEASDDHPSVEVETDLVDWEAEDEGQYGGDETRTKYRLPS